MFSRNYGPALRTRKRQALTSSFFFNNVVKKGNYILAEEAVSLTSCVDAYNRERKNEKTRLYPKGFHPIATPTLIKIEKEKKNLVEWY